MAGFKQAFIRPITSAPWAPATEAGDALGTIRMEGNKFYKVVVLKASQSADVNFAANGDAVGYSDYSASEVVADATDAAQGAAGVIVNFANWDGDFSVAVGKRMWIQIKGPVAVTNAIGGSAAALDRIELNTSSTDLTFDKVTTLKQGCGVFLASTECILDCPF